MPYDYLIPTVLFFIVLVGCFYNIGRYFPRGLIVLFVLCIALIPKYAALTTPYYGTEYEDAFVFQADSKSLTEHTSVNAPFRIQIAEYDLEREGHALRSYTGHFTSFSGLVWLMNKTFGYSRFSAIGLNLRLSGLLFLMLYLTVYIATSSKNSALISVLILASSPVINLFQTSALAETYSSLMVAAFLCFLIRFWMNQKTSHPDILFLVAALLLCLLIKRENMVLLSILPLIGYKLVKYKNYGWFSLLALTLILYFIFVRPFSTEFLEASSIEAPTFSISYLLVQLPAYITAFLKPQLYGVAFWTLCVLIIILFHNRVPLRPESLIVMGVFFGYLTIYCLHYRSRFFVLSMEMSDFETFRYANNFFYLIPLFIGLSVKPAAGHLIQKNGMKYLAYMFFVMFSISIYFSQAVRTAFQSEEVNTRILPLLTANKFIGEVGDSGRTPVLVTDIPIVGKMLDVNEFDVFVQEYQAGHDYFQYKDRQPLYFLVARELATNDLVPRTSIEVIPLDIDTRYIFYRLL